ncbi:hypothetical protein M0805_002076 [Coniferiporia weirii]|nr:hypothetical protein M0805_002076 [Coniferiporia weirii]
MAVSQRSSQNTGNMTASSVPSAALVEDVESATAGTAPTAIHRLIELAADPNTARLPVIECAGDTLSYAQLLTLAAALARELRAYTTRLANSSKNVKLVVAIVSENHPYVLATILGAWLAGGTAATLDAHAPDALLRGMLSGVQPSVVVLPETAESAIRVAKETGVPTRTFALSSNIPSFLEKYSISETLEIFNFNTLDAKTIPAPNDDALYLYTSSASSVQQLKCVPVTHTALIKNAARELEIWYARRRGSAHAGEKDAESSFEDRGPGNFRVLGWGPFSHVMSLAHDFTVYVVIPGGCYVFGIPPAGYPTSSTATGIRQDLSEDKGEEDVEDPNKLGLTLLRTAARTKANVFASVPWVYARFRAACSRRTEYLDVLRGFKQLLVGGALPDSPLLDWAKESGLRLEFSVGMTECGGAVFESDADHWISGCGYPADECLVAGATLKLLGEDGTESDSYGELVIQSRHVSRGYLNIISTAHSLSPSDDSVTIFRTGDIYSASYPSLASPYSLLGSESRTETPGLKPGARLLWEGRRDDYIQLASGELLDPRVPERALAQSPYIARAVLLGDTFGKSAASCVCAVLEIPSADAPAPAGAEEGKKAGFNARAVLRALARVNGETQPPLRVPASRVLVLEEGEQIPINRKNEVWRKKLEEAFGERIRALLRGEGSRFKDAETKGTKEKTEEEGANVKLDEVEGEVSRVVAEVLGISRELLEDSGEATFAELGMDSNMAIRIVSALNARFSLTLPQSAAHDYVDIPQLSGAIFSALTQKSGSKVPTAGLNSKNKDSGSVDADDDVVIVGQAFRLPGAVNDAAAFWDAVLTRRMDVLTHMGSDERWNHASFYVPPGSTAPRDPGTINFTQMGRIEIAAYDAAFFGISPAEARTVTPAARAALEVSLDALENANVTLSDVKGSDLAVFVAQGPEFGFADLLYEEKGFGAYDRYYGTGVADSAISGRLSYFLDVHGPSVTLNTACSGGLVALDNACAAIRHDGCEVAIVCAVNVHVWPGNFGFLSANQMSSLHGRCATFSKDADGYVPSEGAVAFIVKSRRAALRDGDNILGVVRSTAVRHNGRSQGLVAPNSKAQAALTRGVLARAGIEPRDVDFVENHGTGTILGDMMEIQALNEVFGGSHSEEAPLVLGAAKTVFGHTESAAGLVGVIKALLSLQHGVVPGLAHLDGTNLSPRIDPSITPLRISHEATVLRRKEGLPLRALSLSFGFAGTIAAVILEEYRPPKSLEPASSPVQKTTGAPPIRPAPYLFVVSAKTEKALLEYLRAYVPFCKSADETDLANICYTACVGREHYRFRFACSCTSLKDLVSQIEETLSSATKKPISAIASKPRVAFAFPGQGSQWQGMGRALADIDKRFCGYLMDYARQAGELLNIDLMPLLFEIKTADDKDKTSAINETHLSQACIFVFQCAMVQWLGSIGIRPSAILAHSLGEIAAAVVTGVMNFSTALEFVIVRANAMRPEHTDGGLMAALRAPVEPINKRIAALGLSKTVSIAAYNSDTQNVVSGDAQSVRRLVDDLTAKAIKGTILPVNQGFHSQCIDAALVPIRSCLERLGGSIGKPTIAYYSSVEGRALKSDERLNADYWVKQARQPVRFSNAAREFLTESKCQVVLDVGPQNVIAHLLKDAITRTPSNMAISSVCDRPVTNSLSPLMQSMATLFVLGATPNFEEFYAGRRVGLKKTAIPTYPWQKQRHYPTIIPSRTGSSRSLRDSHAYSKSWEIGKELGPLLEKEHTLNGVPIVPAAALAMFVSVEARKARPGSSSVDMRILKPIFLEPLGRDVLKLDISGSSFTCTHLQGDTEKGVICSGTLSVASAAPAISIVNNATRPDVVLDKKDIYGKFGDFLVQFGTSFQCISKIEVSPEQATGLIEVPSSGNTQHDFTRKMDAILHMFGAIAPDGPPELKSSGAFLPSAVKGFTLLTDTIPERFVCRYRLPIAVSPNSKKMTATLEVRDDAGVLLASCTDYVVSWIPSTMPIVGSPAPKKGGISLTRTIWTESLKPTVKADALLPRTVSELVYIGSGSMKEALESRAKSKALNFHAVNDVDSFFRSSKGSFNVVFDVTPLVGAEISESTMISSATAALDFVKAMVPHLRSPMITSVIVVTQDALRIFQDDVDSSLSSALRGTTPSPSSLLGSFIQGMIRVLRQEASTRHVFALDLPSSTSPDEVCDILLHEFDDPSNGEISPIAYRVFEDLKPTRLQPRLVEDKYWVPAPKKEPSSGSRGCLVIVGMDNVGILVAERLMKVGWSAVVFIGEKSRSDVEIASTLINLEIDGVELRYAQADVSSYIAVRTELEKINRELGPIRSIVYTAGIIKNSLIGEVTPKELASAIKLKALGAWNLHLACEELKIEVERFVMLSGTGVLLEKPGQLSRVSVNTFMDELAGYRSSTLQPANRTYSLQLGDRDLVGEGKSDNAQANLGISNSQGLLLLLSAIEGDAELPAVPVLGIARHSTANISSKSSVDVVVPKKSSPASMQTMRPAQISAMTVELFITESLRVILGMSSTDQESLDSSTPVLSLGIDSISFTQLRADVLKKYEVDLPMSFLGEDSLTIGELAEFTFDKAQEQRGSDKNSSTETLVPESAQSAKDAEKFISESLQAVLGMSSEDLDSSMPILSLGIDSISFTQLRADVMKKYDVDIPMSFLGEETLTLSELAEYTIEKSKEANA